MEIFLEGARKSIWDHEDPQCHVGKISRHNLPVLNLQFTLKVHEFVHTRLSGVISQNIQNFLCPFYTNIAEKELGQK